jgi:hypothetical protein
VDDCFWMLVNCKNGVSSCEIARSLGITQKSAWFMVKRVLLIAASILAARKLAQYDGGKQQLVR